MKAELVRVALSVASAGLPLAAGLGIVQLVPLLRRESFPVRCGWGWILGTAWAGATTAFVSIALGLALKRGTVLPLFLLPVAAGLLHRIVTGSGSPRKLGAGRLSLLAVAVGACVTVSILAEAVTNPVRDWDGRMTWAPLARWMRAERTVKPAVLTESWWWVTHPKYPPLLPALDVAVAEAANLSWDGRATRPLRTLFYPAVLLVLFGASRRMAGGRAATAAVLLFASAPFPAFSNHGGAAGEYADLPLAAFYGGGLLLLVLGRRSAAAGAAAGLLLAAAALTKNEGLPLVLVALAGAPLLLPALGERRKSAFAASSAVVLGGAVLLWAYKHGIPNRFDEDYFSSMGARLSVAKMRANLGAALPVVARKTFDVRSWVLLPFLVPALLLAAGRRLTAYPAWLLLGAASLLPCALGLAAYAVGFNVADLASVTWERFLLQGSLPLFALLALAIRRLLTARGSARRA